MQAVELLSEDSCEDRIFKVCRVDSSRSNRDVLLERLFSQRCSAGAGDRDARFDGSKE